MPCYEEYSPEWFFQKVGCEVKSMQCQLTPEQSDLLDWFWKESERKEDHFHDSCFRGDMIERLSTCHSCAVDMTLQKPRYPEFLELLEKAGFIEHPRVIDEDFIENFDFSKVDKDWGGEVKYIDNSTNGQCHLLPYYTTALNTKERLQKRLGWSYIKKKVSGGVFCELAARWKIDQAIRRFKEEHPEIDCAIYHDVELVNSQGQAVTDCDVFVRVGELFYIIEVKACAEVAESYRTGSQAAKVEAILKKCPTCERLYCLGVDDNDEPFSQQCSYLESLDKDFLKRLQSSKNQKSELQ